MRNVRIRISREDLSRIQRRKSNTIDVVVTCGGERMRGTLTLLPEPTPKDHVLLREDGGALIPG